MGGLRKASGSPDHETLRRASRDLRTNPAEALRKLCADPLPENYSAAHGPHAMRELARRAHVRIAASIRSDIPARLRDELIPTAFRSDSLAISLSMLS